MSHAPRGTNFRQQALANALVFVMMLSIFVPYAAAAGMTSCDKDPGAGVDGICDSYDEADDGTPDFQDWIEGTYEFSMVSTEQIELELTWAIYEFDRELLGLSNVYLDAYLANDGLEADDGAPADLIRNFFDQETDGAGSATVEDKLKSEISGAIESSLTSMGEVVVSTNFANQYTNGAVTTPCSSDPATDSAEEGASENNAFYPPICLSTSAIIQVDQSSFNLGSNPDLKLERAYQGLLVMGTEITSSFDFVAQRGHLASYIFNPPSYATIDAVDAQGQLLLRAGTPNYNSGSWVIDHRAATNFDSNLSQSVELLISHRNRTDTTTVEVPEGSKALDLQITLDLRDESAATLDFVAGMYYLDDKTMQDWGISLMEVAEQATVPLVTADGIRLAYHNGLVDLSNFTSQFPIDVIAEGVSSTVAGIDTIEMNNMSWISSRSAVGSMPSGGLNYSHSTGCTEVAPAGVDLHYCTLGAEAMGVEHPVYLQTTSQPFSMRLIDILAENNENEELAVIIDELEEADFERVLNSGLTLETVLDSSYLSAIVPENLPPSELTLEIILPTWVRTAAGGDRLVLKDTLAGNDTNRISFAGTNPYDWRHVIRDANQNVLCPSTNKTCVTTAVEMDAMSFNLNEWTQSVEFEFGLDADVSVYRIGIPTDRIPQVDEHSVMLEALPSDLIRLGLEIASRVDNPMNRTFEIGELLCRPGLSICNESLTFEFTAEGLATFVKRTGELFTLFLHEYSQLLMDNKHINFKEIDISAFEIQTRLKGVGAPDLIVSDEEPLSLTLKIPKVQFELSIGGDLGKLRDGDTSGIQLSLVADAIRSMFIEPMAMLMQGVTGMLTNSIVQWDGVTLPDEDSDGTISVPLNFNTMPHELQKEFEVAVNGPFTVTLPRGITLKNLESAEGNIEDVMVDGRQQITYTLPAGDVEDTITFQLHLTWLYFLVQFWKYPAIILILLLLYVRRRRKKKRIRKIRRARSASASKPKLGNAEFADLSGFHSEALHGDLEQLQVTPNAPSVPPLPQAPPSAVATSALTSVVSIEEAVSSEGLKKSPFDEVSFDVTDAADEDLGDVLFD